MDEENVVYLYNGILPGNTRNVIRAITWMKLLKSKLSLRGQSQKAIYCMIPFI